MLDIANYTLDNWGLDQAVRYTNRLYDDFDLLAGQPSLGRACESLAPGLRRFEVDKHVVFYLPAPAGILVVRIFHQSVLPMPHYFR